MGLVGLCEDKKNGPDAIGTYYSKKNRKETWDLRKAKNLVGNAHGYVPAENLRDEAGTLEYRIDLNRRADS